MAESLDIEKLVAPVDEEHPCGENLEDLVFDPEFAELDRLAQGKPEKVMGDEVIPAEEPDWRAVREKSLALFERVRSLRVAVFLTKALCVREGIAGMVEGLNLVQVLLERYWDEVEPLIDDGDATERLHTLGEIGSEQGLLPLIRQAVLVSSPAIGTYTIRDYLIAADKLTPGKDEETATLTSINQALMDCELDDLQQMIANIDEAVETAGAIETQFNQNVESQYLIDLDPFTKLFAEIRPALHEVLGRRGVVVEGAGSDEVSEEPAAATAAAPASGEIRSREDVVRMLDRITEYYNRHEPSSPVPLLLQRAKRLVSADFMAIIKDVASDGAKQADLLLGRGEGED
jgi:type VI secretion system protein ImpA